MRADTLSNDGLRQELPTIHQRLASRLTYRCLAGTMTLRRLVRSTTWTRPEDRPFWPAWRRGLEAYAAVGTPLHADDRAVRGTRPGSTDLPGLGCARRGVGGWDPSQGWLCSSPSLGPGRPQSAPHLHEGSPAPTTGRRLARPNCRYTAVRAGGRLLRRWALLVPVCGNERAHGRTRARPDEARCARVGRGGLRRAQGRTCATAKKARSPPKS